MKQLYIIALIFLFIAGPALAAERTNLLGNPLNLAIKQLYAAPNDGSQLVYSIPIEVTLLDVSEDANWYKVKIQYNFGPLNYTYVGWTKIPVTEIISKREKKPTKIADLP